MKTDPELQIEILAALKADPLFSGATIDVSVENGVVTLAGTAGTSTIKTGAEEISRNIDGIKAVNQTIQVTSDSDLADDADTKNFSQSCAINF